MDLLYTKIYFIEITDCWKRFFA